MAEQTVEIKDVLSSVYELRDSVKQYGVDAAEHKEKAEKIETFLTKFEEEKQGILLEAERKEKELKEVTERMEAVELELAKTGQTKSVNYKENAEYKALNAYVKFGESGLNQEQKTLLSETKTMRMDDNTSGGVLATSEMFPELIKNITEVSPLRSVSRVVNVSKKTLDIDIRKSIPISSYEGEAEAGKESQPSYGSETLIAARQQVTIPITFDILMDSEFDIQSQINLDVVESFAEGEGRLSILGTGVKQPEGILINSDVSAGAVTTAGVGAITPKDLTMLTGKLKLGYNPMYGFNRESLATFRSFEDTAGNPVWQAGLAALAPNTINGEKYIILKDMPNIATGALPVIYADFKRGYMFIDRVGMSIIRDEFTLASQAIIKFTFRRWGTGKVILSEAFQALKVQ